MGSATKFWIRWLLLSGVAVGCIWYFRLLDQLAPAEVKSAVGVVVQLAVTMLGFVLAALTVLATIAQTKLVRNMHKTGHYGVLLTRMFTCLLLFGLISIVGLVLLFVPQIPAPATLVVLGLVLVSIVALGDVLRKLRLVLDRLAVS